MPLLNWNYIWASSSHSFNAVSFFFFHRTFFACHRLAHSLFGMEKRDVPALTSLPTFFSTLFLKKLWLIFFSSFTAASVDQITKQNFAVQIFREIFSFLLYTWKKDSARDVYMGSSSSSSKGTSHKSIPNTRERERMLIVKLKFNGRTRIGATLVGGQWNWVIWWCLTFIRKRDNRHVVVPFNN